MEERPLPEYATLTAAFWAVFLGFVLTNRGRIPERIPFDDFARIALASYKISRVLTKEEVTSFVRAPVTEDAEAQEPKPEGMARVLGELLTCPYCVGLWIASTLSYSLVRFPRETRFATTIFGAYALSDFLHAGFVRLRGDN
jgi:Protein of unknown function (DUF1360)